ncbi:MAG: hypothetical protein V4532_02270, partial [Pseudomonadota bacterium]
KAEKAVKFDRRTLQFSDKIEKRKVPKIPPDLVRSDKVLAAFPGGLGMMGKYTMIAFGLTAFWTLWGVHGPKRGLMRVGPWAAMAVAAMVVAPNIWWNMQNGFPTLQHTAEITTQSTRHGGFLPMLEFAVGQVLALGPVTVFAALWLLNRVSGNRANNGATPPTQWAASSQMMLPSQWRMSGSALSNSQLTTPGALNTGSEGGRAQALRTSAYYLASVSSYRFLWAMSVPLLLIALAQAFLADAHVNWAAPALIGLVMLAASRLSPPLVSLATPRPKHWLTAVVLSNLILTGLVVHARDIGGDNLPSRLDMLVRMRGWEQAYAKLAPTLEEPTIKGLRVMADNRVLLTQSLYQWRRHNIDIVAWNPKGLRQDHYQFKHSFEDKVGQDVIFVSDRANPQDVLKRFAIVREMNQVHVPIGPDRAIDLHVFFLRGFLGYNDQSYQDQSGSASDYGTGLE